MKKENQTGVHKKNGNKRLELNYIKRKEVHVHNEESVYDTQLGTKLLCSESLTRVTFFLINYFLLNRAIPLVKRVSYNNKCENDQTRGEISKKENFLSYQRLILTDFCLLMSLSSS